MLLEGSFHFLFFTSCNIFCLESVICIAKTKKRNLLDDQFDLCLRDKNYCSKIEKLTFMQDKKTKNKMVQCCF